MKANNFDFLRLFLAFSVVLHHFIILSNSDESFIVFDIVDSNVAVKAFFVISGLLIWISANRSISVRSYAIKRFFRLYPALVFTLITTSTIALLVYKQPVYDVASYIAFNSLLLNFLHPCIGELFNSNLMCAANGALWTLKIEVAYYFFIAFIVFLFRRYSFRLIVFFSMLSFALDVVYRLFFNDIDSFAFPFRNQIPFVFFYFGLGVIVYKYEKYISTTLLFFSFSVGFLGWFVFNVEFFFLAYFCS